MVSSPKDYLSDNNSNVGGSNLEENTTLLCFYVSCFLMVSFNLPDQLSHNHGAVFKPLKLGTIKLHLVDKKILWTVPSIKLEKCYLFIEPPVSSDQ